MCSDDLMVFATDDLDVGEEARLEQPGTVRMFVQRKANHMETEGTLAWSGGT